MVLNFSHSCAGALKNMPLLSMRSFKKSFGLSIDHRVGSSNEDPLWVAFERDIAQAILRNSKPFSPLKFSLHLLEDLGETASVAIGTV
jgi:hypothetical protein